MWEGEWEFWAGQGLHVVSYSGSAAARTVIYEHELWLSPGCLDGKAPKRLKGDIASKVCMLVIWRCPPRAFFGISRPVCSTHETMCRDLMRMLSLTSDLSAFRRQFSARNCRSSPTTMLFCTKSNFAILQRLSRVRCPAVLMHQRYTVRCMAAITT